MKNAYATLFLTLYSCVVVACSCRVDQPKGFFENVSSDKQIVLAVFTDMGVEVEDLGAPAPAARFALLDNISGEVLPDNEIVVLGANGVNCNRDLSFLSPGDTVLLSMYRWKVWSGAQSDTFNLSACFTSHLEMSNGQMAGSSLSEVRARISSVITAANDYYKPMGIDLSPNPATEYVGVKISAGRLKTIRICNLSGQEISKQEVFQDNAIIDLRSLSDGVYILEAETADGLAYSRLVKE